VTERLHKVCDATEARKYKYKYKYKHK